MKLIGVYGGSGAGKSTVTNILNQLLDDSVVLHLDHSMHKYTFEKADELCQKFGITQKPKHLLSYISSKNENNVVWMDTIKSDVEKDAMDFIDAYRDMDYVIVDWAFLSYIDLFDRCDYTILVNGNDEVKIARLKARLTKDGAIDHWNDQYLQRRVRNSQRNCEGPTPSFNVYNDNDHSLSDQLIDIANSIVQDENVARKKATIG